MEKEIQGDAEMRIKSSYYLSKEILAKNPVPEWWKWGHRKWCKYAIGRSKAERIITRKELKKKCQSLLK